MCMPAHEESEPREEVVDSSEFSIWSKRVRPSEDCQPATDGQSRRIRCWDPVIGDMWFMGSRRQKPMTAIMCRHVCLRRAPYGSSGSGGATAAVMRRLVG